MQLERKYILVVEHMVGSIVKSVTKLRKEPAYSRLEIVLLTQDVDRYGKYVNSSAPVSALACDFSNSAQVIRLLAPYREGLCGVICRGDKQIQYLRAIIPGLPPQVDVSTASSLASATSKYLMRTDFLQHFPEISPQFVDAPDSSAQTISRIEEVLTYPVIVKPANLAGSLLIQSCDNRKHLRNALDKVFTQIERVYKREERQSKPQVIVEEYLEGDFYSIDAYVMEADQIYYCPPIAYVPAKQVGIDDFAIYKRFLPTELTVAQIAEAQTVTRKAIVAVGLTHTTIHIELVLTKRGWKVIEIGPRLGRFRHKMYSLGYGIDHSTNDLRIHLGMKPVISTRIRNYCVVYQICPDKEGTLNAIEGLEAVKATGLVAYLRTSIELGQPCLFVKHGGHTIAEFVLVAKSIEQLAEACVLAEQVYADIV